MSLQIVAASKSAAYTGTAGNTADFTANGAMDVIVWCTTDAYVEVGSGVTATSASFPVPAGFPVKLQVPVASGTFRVSAIQVASGGTVYAQPVAR